MLYKYPRTWHCPWSPGGSRDDRVLDSMDHFIGQKVVVTEKMDGENTSIYANHIHARSTTSSDHPSRSWVKALQGRLSHSIPAGWRVCGENLYARHSIGYDDLGSYFLAFSIWTEENRCLDWDSTVEWCELLEIEHVPVLYVGTYDERAIKASWKPQKDGKDSEGYVIRLWDSFAYSDFEKSMAKYVRENHITTSEHWLSQPVVPNTLKR